MSNFDPRNQPDPAPVAAWTFADALERLLRRLVMISLTALLLLWLPLPVVDNWMALRDVLVVIGTILAIGKAVVDTFFYDRYWPHSAPGRK